ncbi:hypothetical protein [Streptomyces stackebrandtii]|uniref:hypothetical protein n=1 Tax=Streptomyces stackebrandtii TaxID=3051177 RepID=UPI0028DB42D5|nr:hypothetical protein [Streptomyces sp. DSM 40976]
MERSKSLGQRDEAAHVVAAFDDGEDQGEGREAVLDEAAGVSAVGPDQGQQALAAVEAAAVRADDRVRFDRLRVDRARARLRVPPGPLADQVAQPVVELADQIVVAPAPEEGVDPVPRWEVAGMARHFVPLSTR